MIEHRSFFSAFCPLSAFRDRTFVLSIFSAFIRHEHQGPCSEKGNRLGGLVVSH